MGRNFPTAILSHISGSDLLIFVRRCENFDQKLLTLRVVMFSGVFTHFFRVVWRCTTPQSECQKSDASFKATS
jgi:hypothetical protein